MAVYKVPQDVEAEDKLIGPFSFRQFIYLGVAALGIGAGVGLWQIFPGLIVIPLPFVILFLALALPLRKDQPMETYLVAVIRYFLKPRKRLWQPEGSIALVTVVAPKVAEVQLTKQVGGAAAAAQLDYLTQVIDTGGWASRGVINPTASMNDAAYAEAQQVEDVLDENTNISRTFDTMIDRTTDEYKNTLREQFQQQIAQPVQSGDSDQSSVISNQLATGTQQDSTVAHQPLQSFITNYPSQYTSADDSANNDQETPHLDYDPYPDMHQHVLSPLASHSSQPRTNSNLSAHSAQSTPTQNTPQKKTTSDQPSATSPEPISPDIMRLANNNDLSISAIANEAHRLEVKDNEEVVINLH